MTTVAWIFEFVTFVTIVVIAWFVWRIGKRDYKRKKLKQNDS
jgi:chromate transport protein ChrA